MANKIILELDLDSKEFNKKLNKTSGKAEKTGRKAGSSFSEGFSEAVKSRLNIKALATGALIAVGAGITGLAVASIKAASKVENLSIQFGTLLKSTSLAKSQINQLVDFAAKTPFRLEGLAEASRTLLAFGTSQRDSIDLLKNLGDAAAGSGSDIKSIALIFGQVRGAAKLTGERLLQLQERGINLVPELAKVLKVAESEVRGIISKGGVGFKTFELAFKNLTTGAGLFAGGMKKLSESTSGLFSTLQDNAFQVFANIGQKFEPIIKKVLKDVTKLVQDIGKSIDFKAVTISLLVFARDVNSYIIIPLQGITSAFNLFFKSIKLGIQEIVRVVLFSAKGLVELANLISGVFNKQLVGDDFIKGLEEAREVTNEVANDMRDDLTSAFNDSFGTGINDKINNYIDELIVGVEKINEVTATVKPIDVLPPAEQTQEQVTTLLDVLEGFSIGFDNAAKTIKKTAIAMASTVKNSLVKGISGGIQNIVNSIMNGENAFANFGKFVIGAMGDMAVQLGTVLIGAGLGVEALKSLGGAAAVAAGIGLVAVGTVMKSLAGSSSATSGASGDNFSGSPVGTNQDASTTQIQEEAAPTKTEVNLTIQGNVLDRRESGLEIVNIINEAIDSDSVVINQAFA